MVQGQGASWNGADGPRRLWKIDDLAEYLGVSVDTIYKWRTNRYGPKAARIGKHLRWRPEDVEAWLDEHRDDSDQ
ncbi:helix-turn-helix domain-containing protein [Frankia sp. Ag45/Mut15]|uniref:Helix-turn-helix domain-containing protein n=1 Tax=Frankia umida TaxID=573489 RepID=A0ABT0K4K7_9ACTN|nr:helix-turn-helix domain-containing protein [Frankia umida]MCK9878253.1 helix-turn-helix domain-containing protein [Frankia umida]